MVVQVAGVVADLVDQRRHPVGDEYFPEIAEQHEAEPRVDLLRGDRAFSLYLREEALRSLYRAGHELWEEGVQQAEHTQPGYPFFGKMLSDERLARCQELLIGALQQMLDKVAWGQLDVLIVDLPPGTGDVQMTLAQKSQLNGAIIVSTPQDIALLDARKGIDMFNQLGTPLIGMIENMSTHICSACGHEEHMFGHGGVAKEAEKLGVPLLAEIPLHMDIRLAADGGAPIVVSKPDSSQAAAFRQVARDLIAKGHA